MHISTWMEKNGYLAVNSEKTIFMKRTGDEYIIHGLFVDDMMHLSTSSDFSTEFMIKYSADYKVTSGSVMETYLSMEVEQSSRDSIELRLKHYIRDLLSEYKDYT